MGDGTKTAIVSGGSSGIGAAVVARLVSAGSFVYILDRQAPTSQVDDAQTAWIEADVSDEMSVDRAFGEAVDATGRIDSLVNCAGVNARVALVETTTEVWSAVMAVNMTGTFLCTRAAARTMLSQRSGSVVSISSVNAQLGDSNCVAYSASKGAVEAFTRAAAAELGPSGIRVNAISPGAIETPMWGDFLPEDRDRKALRTALGVVGSPADVAAAAAFLCSEEARYVTGVVLPVCGGRTNIDFMPA